MTYDNWKTSELDEFPKPSKERLQVELANVEKEIAWNERRLVTLVWGEDDRRQTEDMVADLRQVRQRLLERLGPVVRVKLWDMNASWHKPEPDESVGLVPMKENDDG